jgi:hypothetical protein
MKADYEHYKLNWDFFKSVNPKASELFFIDLQLRKLNETLEDGLVKIDFSNDVSNTLEGYLNEQERQNFFFNKEYAEYLESRKADLLKVNNNELLEYNKVFFVHYQCDNFNEGEQIIALCIYSNGKAKEFSGNESENIKEYADKVNELLNKGLFLVHWNQDRPNYGTDHINKRYYDLKGENLELEYINEINLAEWLIFKYGQNYISHPRLDNLAKLNEFYGIRETELEQRTFATNRLLLLTKIYFNALNNTLKTEVTPLVKALPTQPINSEIVTEKYTAKHHLLAYLFECNAKGESFPIGNKKELERIGNERIGAGKGNRFYKLFNEVINKDLNIEKNLAEIGGEYWRKAVIKLSKTPELVESYLQSKQL